MSSNSPVTAHPYGGVSNQYGAAVTFDRQDTAASKRMSAKAAAAANQYIHQQQRGAYASGPGGSHGSGGSELHLQTVQQHQRGTVQPEDTLEYFIKFPNASHNYRNDGEAPDTDFVFVYKETNVPIVLLLGWAGCQDRYLMKYSKIYEDRGLITVRYTAPVDTLFWRRTAMMPIGEKILKLICDMNFDAHPVIFHIFSNGGAYLYQHISLAMRKHKTCRLQIRGMIFDSAPGERRMLGLYRAIGAIYGREKKKFHSLTAIFITLTLSIMWFVEETFNAFKSLFVKTPPLQANPFSDLKNEPNQFPQMFLYSKGDVVIPHEDVEKFMLARQQRGVDVSSVCFEDAEHVKIFTKYPTQYIHCVCTFINNCLALPYKVVDSYATTPTSVASTSTNTTTKYD